MFSVAHDHRGSHDRCGAARGRDPNTARSTLRVLVILLAAAALAACSTRSLEGLDAATAGPAIDHAVADCEARYQSRALTSYEQVAECEQAVALPEQKRAGPYLGLLYTTAWDNKIELYRDVDAGRLAKPDADQQQAIDSRNMITIIRSIRRF